MNLSFLKRPQRDMSVRELVERAAAKASPNLSVTGMGTVADWLVVLAVGCVLFVGFLWHGWYSYGVQSHKEFGPGNVELAEAASRSDVARAITFLRSRSAADPVPVAPVVVPPMGTSSSSIETTSSQSYDAGVPAFR